MKIPFCGFTGGKLSELQAMEGVPPDLILRAISSFYRRRIHDFNQMRELPKSFRNQLNTFFESGLTLPVNSVESSDHSIKYLFFTSGRAYETVFIPGTKRRTVCISTQSGCRMGCPFCVTGKSGFSGNLSAGEIINQVISMPASRTLTHVVFMGMGEPLDNPDEVLTACRILTSSWGLAISPAHITVSTVGITPGVERFLTESHCNLTLSLFSPYPDERARAIPAERVYPAEEIIRMMKYYPDIKKRRFSIAYLMMNGINDTDRHLEGLVKLLEGSRIRVNLLPFHSTGGEELRASSPARLEYFRQNLLQKGISASVRKSRGVDISAACGMLAADSRTPGLLYARPD